MKVSFLKILSLISGVLLIFSGVVSIFNWFGAITSVSMILGLAMLIAGIFSVLLALLVRGEIFGAPWLMRDGVLSIVTSLLLFSAAAITSERVTVILAMWSVCCGIGRLFGSFEQRRKRISGWWIFLLGSLVSVILGVSYFYIPSPIDFLSNLFTGLFLAVQGLAFGFLWFEEQAQEDEPVKK